MSSWDADRFCTMIPATGRAGCSQERPHCISTAMAPAACWSRSFQAASKYSVYRTEAKTPGRDIMGISRRRFVTGVAGLGLSRAVAPDVARAADGPIRIGLLTVKTGPLASGGIRSEEHTSELQSRFDL